MGAAENHAPPRQEAAPGRGAAPAPAPAPEAVEKVVFVDQAPPPQAAARLQAQRPLAPLQVTTQAPPPPMSVASGSVEPPPQVAAYQPVMQPPQQGPLPSLNSRKYTNGITLCLFLLHLAAAAFAMGFFVFKTAQEISQHPRSHNARRERSLLRDWLLPVEGAVALSIVLAFAWQKAVRAWPRAMVRVILWSSFGVTLAVGALLMCFSMLATVGLGVAMVVFSIGTGLYACWVTRRVGFTARVDSDITSSVCFLTGVTSGALCAALAGSWAFATHRHYTATVSLLAFYVGYLMTRIGMALPQACVGCYYVCYAENPTSRLFDGTIPDRLSKMEESRDPLVPTPRFPHQHGGGA